jgi:hypothetical protein
MNNSYRCSKCCQIFEKIISDKQAIKELHETFGNFSTDDCVIVCDDCYQQLKPISREQFRKQSRTDLANIYRNIRKDSTAMARLFWQANKEVERNLVNLIMYGK